MVRDQTYGQVLAARFQRLSELPTWSKQGTYTGATDLGGALFDLHIHDTDFIQFLRPPLQRILDRRGPAQRLHRSRGDAIQLPGRPSGRRRGPGPPGQGFNMSYTLFCERATLDFNLGRGAEAMQVTEPDSLCAP